LLSLINFIELFAMLSSGTVGERDIKKCTCCGFAQMDTSYNPCCSQFLKYIFQFALFFVN
jgi:hypothetical protein